MIPAGKWVGLSASPNSETTISLLFLLQGSPYHLHTKIYIIVYSIMYITQMTRRFRQNLRPGQN